MSAQPTLTVAGETWHAPKCSCGAFAQAVSILPPAKGFGAASFTCARCKRTKPLTRKDVHTLREPHRVVQRMAEIRAGRW